MQETLRSDDPTAASPTHSVSVTKESLLKDLKILIVSTPRSGNTWVKYCLSLIYDLPVVEFPTPEFWRDFDCEQYDKLGSRWIAHQHLLPFEPFVRWAQDRGVVMLTTVRHPADILVSLYYYIQNFAHKTQIDSETVELLVSNEAMEKSRASSEARTALESYVQEKFFKTLHFSIAWLQRDLSYGIRYEDLWYSPVKTFQALTSQICPVPLQSLAKTVEKCRLEQMRIEVGEDALFFRGGGVGGWKSSLPPSIIQLLRQLPPYPLQFKWLGYTLEPDAAPAGLPGGRMARVPPPSAGLSFFPLDIMPQGHQTSTRGEADSGQAYYPWLNAVSENDPHAGRIAPVITNLGSYLHRTRADLREAFPDLYGTDRVAFSHWFTEVSFVGSRVLDPYFVVPVYESWLNGFPPVFSPVHVPSALAPPAADEV